MLDRARDRAISTAYSAGWGLVKALPRMVGEPTFLAAADAAAVRNGRGARQLRTNLRRVVGPTMSELRMDRLVGEALRSYARYWYETFRLETMDHAAVVAAFAGHFSGLEHIDRALAAGTGAVVTLPHSGNWDVSGLFLVEHSGPFTTVAERLKPASVFDRFVAYRESIGMEVVALSGGERSPVAVLSERLRQNRVVCLLADRDLSHNGIQVDFFGEPTRMPAGPALLAATTGAPLLPAHTYFPGPDTWGFAVDPPVALPGARLRDRVTAGTQAMADAFARRIRGKPEDWHMLQRLWLADLPPRPTSTARTDGGTRARRSAADPDHRSSDSVASGF